MRVLALSNYYPPLIKGGLEISASIICRSLADFGHQVDVLTRRHDPEFEAITDNLRVHRLFEHRYRFEGIRDRHQKLHGWFAVEAAFRNGSVNKPLLREFLRGHEFDVALCFSLQDIGTSLATELDRHGIPCVWSVADYWHLERKRFGEDGWLARMRRDLFLRSEVRDELAYPFDNIIFISNYIRSAYAEAGISPKHSYVVNRSYPIPATVEPYPSVNRAPVFMVACQLAHHKGIHNVVAAATELEATHGDRNWRVEIYGDGESDYINDIAESIEKKELADRVQLMGKISHTQIGQQMQRSIAFIHAAIWEEPFGRVAIESMANGIPLIAGKASAIQEIVEDGGALLYDRFDPSALADMMRVVLDDPSRCSSMVATGLERHRTMFVPSVEQSKMESILQEVSSAAYSNLD